MNLSNDLSSSNQSENTGDCSSENVSAENVNNNCVDEFTSIDSQTESFSSINNLENHQTQEFQANLAAVPKNLKVLTTTDEEFSPTTKKARPRHTAYQICEMEKVFRNNNGYINREEKRKLAARLNLDELQIKVWFQNRRTKEKKTEQNQNQSQNNETTISNNQPELGVQFAPMNYYNANNNFRTHPLIQQFQNYPPSYLPFSTIDEHRNNSQPILPSVPTTNFSREYVGNIRYPIPNNLNYFNNNPSGLQGFPPPPQFVSQPQLYQNYNQLYSNSKNLRRPHLPPK